MKYKDYCNQNAFSMEEILAFGHGTLLEDAPEGFAARFPIPPMLMVDRITSIETQGKRGRIVAERDEVCQENDRWLIYSRNSERHRRKLAAAIGAIDDMTQSCPSCSPLVKATKLGLEKSL